MRSSSGKRRNVAKPGRIDSILSQDRQALRLNFGLGLNLHTHQQQRHASFHSRAGHRPDMAFGVLDSSDSLCPAPMSGSQSQGVSLSQDSQGMSFSQQSNREETPGFDLSQASPDILPPHHNGGGGIGGNGARGEGLRSGLGIRRKQQPLVSPGGQGHLPPTPPCLPLSSGDSAQSRVSSSTLNQGPGRHRNDPFTKKGLSQPSHHHWGGRRGAQATAGAGNSKLLGGAGMAEGVTTVFERMCADQFRNQVIRELAAVQSVTNTIQEAVESLAKEACGISVELRDLRSVVKDFTKAAKELHTKESAQIAEAICHLKQNFSIKVIKERFKDQEMHLQETVEGTVRRVYDECAVKQVDRAYSRGHDKGYDKGFHKGLEAGLRETQHRTGTTKGTDQEVESQDTCPEFLSPSLTPHSKPPQIGFELDGNVDHEICIARGSTCGGKEDHGAQGSRGVVAAGTGSINREKGVLSQEEELHKTTSAFLPMDPDVELTRHRRKCPQQDQSKLLLPKQQQQQPRPLELYIESEGLPNKPHKLDSDEVGAHTGASAEKERAQGILPTGSVPESVDNKHVHTATATANGTMTKTWVGAGTGAQAGKGGKGQSTAGSILVTSSGEQGSNCASRYSPYPAVMESTLGASPVAEEGTETEAAARASLMESFNPFEEPHPEQLTQPGIAKGENDRSPTSPHSHLYSSRMRTQLESSTNSPTRDTTVGSTSSCVKNFAADTSAARVGLPGVHQLFPVAVPNISGSASGSLPGPVEGLARIERPYQTRPEEGMGEELPTRTVWGGGGGGCDSRERAEGDTVGPHEGRERGRGSYEADSFGPEGLSVEAYMAKRRRKTVEKPTREGVRRVESERVSTTKRKPPGSSASSRQEQYVPIHKLRNGGEGRGRGSSRMQGDQKGWSGEGENATGRGGKSGRERLCRSGRGGSSIRREHEQGHGRKRLKVTEPQEWTDTGGSNWFVGGGSGGKKIYP